MAVAAAVFTIAVVLDQTTKAVVESTMSLGQKIPVIDPVLSWHYILNPGAAFSIGTDVTWIFTILQAAVVVYVATLLRKVRHLPWALALGGVAGGAAGNLIDRLFREPSFGMGHVVDFIALPDFAVFNVADSFVVCSMIGVCLLIFRGVNLDGSREGVGPPADDAPESGRTGP
ncbi:signal peptidase II [Zhihengliuella sp.]|uniref:signal peptidase II n=1 Tax=Zhihengliuella sp. TaxID=1954483 RepID=UPI002811B8BF|nr:signal peptidase II [Zhihengliuella sp.]